ncbi:MAG: ABC transporter permease [Christensenella sp.]|nr:ABC transporter permease [Christensenella sp.]
MRRFFSMIFDFCKSVWKEKKKIFALAKNDMKSRYAGSFLGIFWAYFMPLVSILVYWFVFEKGLKATPPANTSVPYIVWFMAGLVPWFYFSEAWSSSTNVLMDYSYLVKQMVFDVRIMPFVRVLSAFFVHMVFMVILFVVMGIYGALPLIKIGPLLYYVLCLICLILAVSVLSSALMPFIRDMTQVIGVITTLGFWMTPIAWPYESMTISRPLMMILKANPMFYVVQGYRDSLISTNFSWQGPYITAYFWIFTLVLMVLGVVAYRRLRPHFADVI